MSWLRNPWGRPRFLGVVTVGYIVWAVLTVLLAIAFAFNDGRSRTTWQGFSKTPGSPSRARPPQPLR